MGARVLATHPKWYNIIPIRPFIAARARTFATAIVLLWSSAETIADFINLEKAPWEQAVWLSMSAMPWRAAGSSVEVRKFWVKEKYRRLGHGTRALAFASHKLFTAKAKYVTVSTASQSGTVDWIANIYR